MAEEALSDVISALCWKLASPLVEKFGYLYGVEKDLKKLESTFREIEAVLIDAEEQQWTNNGLRDWLGKLKEVAGDLHNILDEFKMEDRRCRVRGRMINKVRNFFTPSNPIAFYFKMARKIRKAMVRLEVIAKERFNFNLRERERRNQTLPFILERKVYGREESKEKLVQMLIGQENEEDVSVLPIVGRGGVGKTTLAKLVYNDERVNGYYDQRIWVWVSLNFDLEKIVRAAIESATGEKFDFTPTVHALQMRLREILHGKKYLLVLDDVWSVTPEWSELKTLLACGMRGSKIIVTTGDGDAATITGTLPPYHLLLLSEASCWSVFKQRAFPEGDEEAYPNLVDIGKEIVKKCYGLPLAASALGGMLHSERTERKWLSVRDAETWDFDVDPVLAALKFSFDQLPYALKDCFAYCSIFPKGSRFLKEKLCEYWIVQDLIQPSRENELMEDASAQCFDELCWRSFFQEVSSDGMFEMHDIIHDLAIIVAKPEISIVEDGRRENLLGSAHHESFGYDRMSFISLGSERKILEVPDEIFSLVYLQILDLSFTKIRRVPGSIRRLKHLRYLDLSNSSIEALPKSVGTLHKLQVLKLQTCFQLTEFRSDISKMVRLRCLDINSPWLIQMPRNIGQLSGLQRLTLFIVGKESGCRIEELQGLNLRDELEIRGLENVPDQIDAEKAGLMEKQNLISLKLTWKHDDGLDVVTNTKYEEVIEGLQPHSNIQKLHITNFMGARFPLWLIEWRFPNLVEIHLFGCERCKSLPRLSHFFSLKVVKIKHMPELVWWPGDETREMLPRVEKLTVSGCPKLRQIPHLPCLTELVLVGCSNKVLQGFVGNFASLNSIWISGFPYLTTFPEGFFHNKSFLKSVTVMYCPNLKSLPQDLKAHTAIKELIFL